MNGGGALAIVRDWPTVTLIWSSCEAAEETVSGIAKKATMLTIVQRIMDSLVLLEVKREEGVPGERQLPPQVSQSLRQTPAGPPVFRSGHHWLFGVRRFIAAFCPCLWGVWLIIGKFLSKTRRVDNGPQKAAINRRTPKPANGVGDCGDSPNGKEYMSRPLRVPLARPV
jgi:hypothetical protein